MDETAAHALELRAVLRTAIELADNIVDRVEALSDLDREVIAAAMFIMRNRKPRSTKAVKAWIAALHAGDDAWLIHRVIPGKPGVTEARYFSTVPPEIRRAFK